MYFLRQHVPQALTGSAGVLLLSGFLIGLALADLVHDDLRKYVLHCGIVGLISFVGLYAVAVSREKELLARLRQQEVDQAEQVMAPYLEQLKSFQIKARGIVGDLVSMQEAPSTEVHHRDLE